VVENNQNGVDYIIQTLFKSQDSGAKQVLTSSSTGSFLLPSSCYGGMQKPGIGDKPYRPHL